MNTGDHKFRTFGRKRNENPRTCDKKKQSNRDKFYYKHVNNIRLYFFVLYYFFLNIPGIKDKRLFANGHTLLKPITVDPPIRYTPLPNQFVGKGKHQSENHRMNTGDHKFRTLGRERHKNPGTKNKKQESSEDKHKSVHIFTNIYIIST